MRNHILLTTALLSLPSIVSSIRLEFSKGSYSIEIDPPSSSWNDEEFLSRGYTIPLSCVTAPTLERIPTISSKKAERILREKRSLLDRLSRGVGVSFISVHGIGEKGARHLERYISYDSSLFPLPGGCEG